MATHSSIPAWGNHRQRTLVESWTRLKQFTVHKQGKKAKEAGEFI